jgi:PAS domain S-box-containing protein
MRLRPGVSLRSKLLLWCSLIALTVGLVGAIAASRQVAAARALAISEAQQVALSIAASITHEPPHRQHPSLYQDNKYLQDYVSQQHILHQRDLEVLNLNKEIIAEAVPDDIGKIFTHDELNEVGRTLKDGITRTFIEVSEAYPQGVKQIVVPLKTKNNAIIGALLYEYSPIYQEMVSLAHAAVRDVLTATLFGLALTIGLGFLFSGYIIGPLKKLEHAALQIAGGNLAAKVEVSSHDEVGQLANAFNSMSHDLQDANQKLVTTIAQRRQAEEALGASERYLTSIFNSILDGVTIQDTEFNIIRINPTAERWFAEAQPLVGKKCYEAKHGRNKPCLDCPVVKTLETGNAAQVRKPKRGDDPAGGWVEIYAYPLVDAATGKISGVIEYARDLTDQKHAEESLRRSEEQLRQAVKMEAIGRLAGGVAHDFNNIMTAIVGYSELLLMEFPEQDPHRQDVKEILQAAARAASLTRQLLAFSRKQVLRPCNLNLNAVVANMDKMLRRIIGEDIDLVTVLDPHLEIVRADPGQIEQVIMNLAVNARDAMPQGGKITLETANVNLDELYARRRGQVRPGPYVMLALSDTGEGMDAEAQTRIFEPFFTTKRQGKGTGLGLSTVYGIVKQSGGFIWVYSEPREGSTFKIYLPRLAEHAAAAVSLIKAPCSDRGSETILLVEDEEPVREVIHRMLRQNGYQVLAAADGPEALRLSRQHPGPIHLMLTDVVMPGMSGHQVMEQLRPERPEMQVLYMSGHTENAIVHHGVLEPGVAFVQKPFRQEELLLKVRGLLDLASTA